MAGGRSQRHLREFYGIDSAGETRPGIGPPGQVGGSAVVTTAAGTTAVAAVVTLAGNFVDGDSIVVNIQTDQDSAANFTYNADFETAASACTGLAAAIDEGFSANLDATVNSSTVEILAKGTATTVTINSATIV